MRHRGQTKTRVTGWVSDLRVHETRCRSMFISQPSRLRSWHFGFYLRLYCDNCSTLTSAENWEWVRWDDSHDSSNFSITELLVLIILTASLNGVFPLFSTFSCTALLDFGKCRFQKKKESMRFLILLNSGFNHVDTIWGWNLEVSFSNF